MGVMILVILEQAHHHLTVHQSESAALRALASYVSRHWSGVMNGSLFPLTESERIDRFFNASSSEYFIAELEFDVLADTETPKPAE